MKHSVISMLIILIALLINKTTIAGSDSGNGGDVLVCPQHGQITIELLDFYEGRTRFGYKFELGDPSLPYMTQVAGAIQRLRRIDPLLADKLTAFAQSFEQHTHFWPGIKLEDVPDSKHIAIPTDCRIEQIAVQKAPQFPEEKYYTVNKDLWDQLDERNRAGLVLHEIIFRIAITEAGHQNSISTRYFNMQLFRQEFESLSLA